MDEKDVLQTILLKLSALEQKVDAVDRKVDAVDRKVDAVDRKVDAVEQRQEQCQRENRDMFARLEEKIDRNYTDTVKAVDRVVTVVGEQIHETEQRLSGKIDAIEAVTAQNSFDVQYLKRKA